MTVHSKNLEGTRTNLFYLKKKIKDTEVTK